MLPLEPNDASVTLVIKLGCFESVRMLSKPPKDGERDHAIFFLM